MLLSTQNLPAARCCSAARAPVNSPTAFQIKAGQLEALLGVGFKVLQLSPKKKPHLLSSSLQLNRHLQAPG